MLEKTFTAAGVNARSHCLTSCYGRDAIVYASALQLVLKSIPQTSNEVGSVLAVSERRHSLPITVLKEVKSDGSDFFISGGTDKKVALWRLDNDFVFLGYLEGAKASVSSVSATMISDSDLMAVAAWADENGQGVQAWKCSMDGTVSSTATVPIDSGVFALCTDVTHTTNGTLIAIGTSKRFVELYTNVNDKFVKLVSVAGHSDWIHAIAFNDNNERILLASAGQDNVVRLWSVAEKDDKIEEDLTSTGSRFQLGDVPMLMASHAVLEGHEDWVHSLVWDTKGEVLLTASSDKTNIVWRESEGLWQDEVRLGIVGGQAAGFYAATFGRKPTIVVASSYFGGLYSWAKTEDSSWEARTMVSGHNGEVRDVDWQRGADGRSHFVVSVGQDQTTRVFAKRKNTKQMVEISRAQVHGHDLQCVATVSPTAFVSGAEEKIFRAFRAPKSFATSLAAITGESESEVFGDSQLTEFGACVPALGLSNKAMAEGETVNGEHWEEDAFRAAPASFLEPPTEDALQQNTLWPEEHKLYGHGYEVYAIARNPSGSVLATACKSSQQEYSTIMLWDTSDWSKKAEVTGHQLTVTQIEWSPDGNFLLSVSRDRTAKLYRELDGNLHGFNYQCVWTSAKQHTRIIWSCSWFSDSDHFVTGARDQNVIVWERLGASAEPVITHNTKMAVTAVAASAGVFEKTKILVGVQTGEVQFFGIDGSTLRLLQNVVQNSIPIDAPILRIRFSQADKSTQDVAIACADAKLDVYKLLL